MDAAIAKNDVAILRYMQPASRTTQQFADDLLEKFCKGADVYDGNTLNEEFIEVVHASIRDSMQDYWASHPHAASTDIAFHVESLLAILKGSRNISYSNKVDYSVKLYQKNPWQRALANSVNAEITTFSTRGTRSWSWSPYVL